MTLTSVLRETLVTDHGMTVPEAEQRIRKWRKRTGIGGFAELHSRHLTVDIAVADVAAAPRLGKTANQPKKPGLTQLLGSLVAAEIGRGEATTRVFLWQHRTGIRGWEDMRAEGLTVDDALSEIMSLSI